MFQEKKIWSGLLSSSTISFGLPIISSGAIVLQMEANERERREIMEDGRQLCSRLSQDEKSQIEKSHKWALSKWTVLNQGNVLGLLYKKIYSSAGFNQIRAAKVGKTWVVLIQEQNAFAQGEIITCINNTIMKYKQYITLQHFASTPELYGVYSVFRFWQHLSFIWRSSRGDQLFILFLIYKFCVFDDLLTFINFTICEPAAGQWLFIEWYIYAVVW